MSNPVLQQQRDTFNRLVSMGEEVVDALDYVLALSERGATELERTHAAIGDRPLPPVAQQGLYALTEIGRAHV